MIKIRKTQPTDIAILMDIFEQAKHIMRKDGNMLQWRGNYFQGNRHSRHRTRKQLCVHRRYRRNYRNLRLYPWKRPHIYAYLWRKWWRYASLRRHSPAGKYRTQQRSGQCCLQWCYEQIPNLRADTHRDNHILQYILKKHEFKYCGIILLPMETNGWHSKK